MKIKEVFKTPTYFATLQLTQDERNNVILGLSGLIKAVDNKEVKLPSEQFEAIKELKALINSMKSLATDKSE